MIAMKRKRFARTCHFARMEAWRDVSLREDESLARVSPLEGINQLGEEEFGQGIKVIKREAAHVRRSKKLKSRGPVPLPRPRATSVANRGPTPLPPPTATLRHFRRSYIRESHTSPTILSQLSQHLHQSIRPHHNTRIAHATSAQPFHHTPRTPRTARRRR